jgi:hypothetical protein
MTAITTLTDRVSSLDERLTALEAKGTNNV